MTTKAVVTDFGLMTLEAPSGSDRLYYIVSRERLLIAPLDLRFPTGLQLSPCWWMPGGGGYTARLEEAGKYTGYAAAKILSLGIPDNRPRGGDFAVPCDLAELVVAMIRNCYVPHVAAAGE